MFKDILQAIRVRVRFASGVSVPEIKPTAARTHSLSPPATAPRVLMGSSPLQDPRRALLGCCCCCDCVPAARRRACTLLFSCARRPGLGMRLDDVRGLHAMRQCRRATAARWGCFGLAQEQHGEALRQSARVPERRRKEKRSNIAFSLSAKRGRVVLLAGDL